MKFKQKKSSKLILSDKIAEALTVTPRADIEDDHIFDTKPSTLSRVEYSSDSEEEAAISDFRKRNVNLLSDISKKYEGTIVSRKELVDILQESSDDLSEEEVKLTSHISSGKRNEKSTDGSVLKNKKLLPKFQFSSENNEDLNDKGEINTNEQLDEQEELTSDDDRNENNDSNESDNSNESDDYNIIKKQTHSKNARDESDDSVSEDEEDEGYDISQLKEPVIEEFEHVKKLNISEEAKKGASVRNQLLMWESLLEMRIHLQKCMNTANSMPMADIYGQLKCCNEFQEERKVTINNVANILEKFLTLQNVLLKKFPETKNLSNNKQMETVPKANEESDEEIPSDTDNEEVPSDIDAEDGEQGKTKTPIKVTINNSEKKRKLEDYESDISVLHKSLKTFRNTTIQKWNEKTRLATATNIKSAPTNTILQQISYILSDREKLIRRTQLKRSDYDIVGYKNPLPSEKNEQDDINVNPVDRDRKDNDEYIPEIFDDSDFYHQLLRELIECKSADISDPVQLSRQWIALQQMRSKMKRKVDTRATKGRKIKYVVHNKLVSYMAPEKSLKWNDESTNELYSSLFGKMFEHNNVGVNIDLDNVRIK